MDDFVLSTGLVTLAEMGDKTQLLALLLAARFRRPWPIMVGILTATLLNHLGAGALGAGLMSLLTPNTLRWILGLSFLAMSLWMLVPDQLDGDAAAHRNAQTWWGIWGTTALVFFSAEMGDKTQLATIALAAQAQSLVGVVAGTTLGMMIANAPVVFLGERITRRLPVMWIHRAAAALLALLGLTTLLGGLDVLGLPHHRP